MRIEDFFDKNKIDDYSILDISKIENLEGFNPDSLLPNSKSIIVFAKQIPGFIFFTDKKIKTHYLYSIIKEMDKISYDLSVNFINDGFNAVAIPCFFPIRLKNGRMKGYLSFKHLAEQAGMGSIGLNSLLISEKYGNRLCFSAIITEKCFTVVKTEFKKPLCHNCYSCVNSCPSKAIKNGYVEAAKCINFQYSIPKIIRPLVNIFMKWNLTRKYMEILINTMSWNIEMICSECLINCPYFK